jgi:SAM-dependent methyltransferase
MMLDFLDEIRATERWGRHLDIGGAGGHHAALFRAHRLSRYSVSLDIERYDESRLIRWFFYYAHLLQSRINWCIGKARSTGKYGVNLPWGSSYYRFPIFARPIADEMVVDDFYALSEKFDVITSFLSMNHFEFRRFIRKVADLLNDKGVFYFVTDYWWYPVNSTGIVGRVPYAAQQFTLEELKDHFAKHLPDELPYLEKSYNYFLHGSRPVLEDYVSICDENSLKLISVKRIIPNLKVSPRTPWTPKLMQEYEETQLTRVLENARRLDPRVSLLDLETGWVMGAFRKVTVKPGLPPI